MNHGKLFAFMKSYLENVKEVERGEKKNTTKINILRVRILLQNSLLLDTNYVQ